MLGTFITTREVADCLRTSPSTVRYWRHLGIGPKGVKIGRKVLYDKGEVARWVQAQTAAQQAEGR